MKKIDSIASIIRNENEGKLNPHFIVSMQIIMKSDVLNCWNAFSTLAINAIFCNTVIRFN